MVYKNIIAFCFVFASIWTVYGQKQFRNDYSYFGEVDGWYKMHLVPATWIMARLRCHLENAVLASPTTRQQDQAMNIMMLRYGIKSAIFTGIHATFSKGDYYTVDGIPLSDIPQKWALDEPDNLNNNETCIKQNSDGSLADVSCDITLPYMCFKKYIKGMAVNPCGTTDPEYKYAERTGKCYKYHLNPRTWTRAFMTCAAEGGHLAVINSDDEIKAMLEIIQSYPAEVLPKVPLNDLTWVGFHDWGESYDFRTIHGQTLEEAGYAKWWGEPSSPEGKENCGSIVNKREGMVNDLGCGWQIPAICEKAPNTLLDKQ